ncbi:MAG: DUF2975 domain-containing protein [Paludibacterium sp.]|uniref:DUF2975 domain-containing protein n=1 Tax=Paludibacterium sp. TaxID=1917523 RepID=UPI0025D2CA72|nr:DUF2975 domain-containing protein [Paludibacterium sp.]MBV8045724.1 DUF2975 domain-containing protein [Paludibacterium sp.]
MTSQQISKLSAALAAISTALVAATLLLNVLCWFNPDIAQQYGLRFGMPEGAAARWHVDLASLAGWQLFGAAAISSIPLTALAAAFWCSRGLFHAFSRGAYFSEHTAELMSRIARYIALWVGLSLVSEPALSMWLTATAPAGGHVVSLSLGSPDLVALYLAGCLAVIAHVLRAGVAVEQENQQFI